MANLSITPADVAPVEVWEQLTGPVDEAIDAGEMVRINVTTGLFTLANASSAAEGRAIGMAITSANQANLPITVVKQGIVDLGAALDSESFDEALLLSNTDGKIDDGAGAPTGSYNVGRVVPLFGSTGVDRALLIEL